TVFVLNNQDLFVRHNPSLLIWEGIVERERSLAKAGTLEVRKASTRGSIGVLAIEPHTRIITTIVIIQIINK
ncbi:MAG: hypothetical protein ACREIQ_06935, partial [Nitrospiria bacterium]